MPRDRKDIERQFCQALERIKAYRSTEWLRKNAEKAYGLSYEEALEMAYENVIEEARNALFGYRKPKAAAKPESVEASTAPEGKLTNARVMVLGAIAEACEEATKSNGAYRQQKINRYLDELIALVRVESQALDALTEGK
jgi:formylmethanofuran dehydrogenase subunit B